MSQITVRNIPEPVEVRLRQLADGSGASLNQTVLRVLEVGTGLAPAAGPKRDLAAFSGRWTAAAAAAFDTATKIFETLDDEVWR
jgi:plasmid stability protein